VIPITESGGSREDFKTASLQKKKCVKDGAVHSSKNGEEIGLDENVMYTCLGRSAGGALTLLEFFRAALTESTLGTEQEQEWEWELMGRGMGMGLGTGRGMGMGMGSQVRDKRKRKRKRKVNSKPLQFYYLGLFSGTVSLFEMALTAVSNVSGSSSLIS
jgi:hypothetical protein